MRKTIFLMAFAALASITFAQKKTNDSSFVMKAAQGGLLEVKLGELAGTNGSSEDVKTLGKHMVTDHTKANNELMDLAGKKGITVPKTLSKEGQKHYDELSKKTGEEFDKAYAKLMVKDHEKVISEFKKESEKGSDADLKAWASKTLPTLEHHLMMSKDCDAKINKMSKK